MDLRTIWSSRVLSVQLLTFSGNVVIKLAVNQEQGHLTGSIVSAHLSFNDLLNIIL